LQTLDECNLVTFFCYIPKQPPKQNAFVGTVVAVILSLKQQKLLLLIGRVGNCSIAGLLCLLFLLCSYLLFIIVTNQANQLRVAGLLGYWGIILPKVQRRQVAKLFSFLVICKEERSLFAVCLFSVFC